jgi:hypothetical protein
MRGPLPPISGPFVIDPRPRRWCRPPKFLQNLLRDSLTSPILSEVLSIIELMFDKVESLTTQMQELVSSFKPETVDGAQAEELLRQFIKLERLASAGKTLCAQRVVSSGQWKNGIDRSPARWLARTAGVSVGDALALVETAQGLPKLPAVEQALKSGKISESQAVQVTSAAQLSPSSQRMLLEAAERMSLAELKTTCARVSAAALPDHRARMARVHQRRYLRSWLDPDGAFRLDGSMTPVDGATVMAALEPYVDKLADQARSNELRESTQALRLDALVELAEHSLHCTQVPAKTGSRHCVQVLISHSALERGHLVEGERCEIKGPVRSRWKPPRRWPQTPSFRRW